MESSLLFCYEMYVFPHIKDLCWGHGFHEKPWQGEWVGVQVKFQVGTKVLRILKSLLSPHLYRLICSISQKYNFKLSGYASLCNINFFQWGLQSLRLQASCWMETEVWSLGEKFKLSAFAGEWSKMKAKCSESHRRFVSHFWWCGVIHLLCKVLEAFSSDSSLLSRLCWSMSEGSSGQCAEVCFLWKRREREGGWQCRISL